MSREVLLAVYNDYDIPIKCSYNSELYRFREARNNLKFIIGDRVRITHGLKTTNDPPSDTETDGSIGLFGTVEGYTREREEMFCQIPWQNGGCNEFGDTRTVYLWIKLLPYEKKDNMWYPSGDEKGDVWGDDHEDGLILGAYVKLERDSECLIKVPAADLVNYTVLGDQYGDKLFEETKDRILDLRMNISKNPWPEEWNSSLWLTANNATKLNLDNHKQQIFDQAMTHYVRIWEIFVELGRQQRWRVQHMKCNAVHPRIEAEEGEDISSIQPDDIVIEDSEASLTDSDASERCRRRQPPLQPSPSKDSFPIEYDEMDLYPSV